MTSPRGRIERRDVAIAVAFSALAVWFVLDQTGRRDVDAIAAPFVVAITVPVLWRRAAPLLATAATIAMLLLHAAFFSGGELVTALFVMPLLLLYAYTTGVQLPRGEARAGLALSVALAVAMCLTDGPDGATPDSLSFIVPLTAAIWGVGRLVRSRREMADELVRRTDDLRVARDERARLEVASDRARLSSELDTLLQRRLSELAQLADAGGSERDPQRAAAALVQIEQAGRETLTEMREVVGVLRGAEDDAPRDPQPTLTHLDALLVRAKGAGARLEVEGAPRVLPPGVELSAYRVVEHLLEALDDAPGVAVTVRFADDALELAVRGPARRRRDDAIERARERVRLHDGTLEATTRDGRAETIVSLPLYAGA